MFERYTEKARRVIFFARYEASQFGSLFIESEHVLMGLLREDKALTNRFLRSRGSIESIREQIEAHTVAREKVSTSVDLPLSNECKRVVAYAAEESERLGHKHIGTEHLLLGLLREENCFAAQILRERGLTLVTIREELVRMAVEPEARTGAGSRSEFSQDLTQAAIEGQLESVVGRDAELDGLIDVLCGARKQNAILVGERGAGKAAIVEAFAQRIAEGAAPLSLVDKRVLVVDVQRATARAVADASGIILFVGELRSLLSPGSVHEWAGAPGLLKYSPLKGKVQCIATSTPSDYRECVRKAPWLEDSFRAIYVRPLSEEDTLKVLEARKSAYEKFHEVSYSPEALVYAAQSEGRYLPESILPGKALELLDAAGARVKLRQGAVPVEILEAQKRINLIVQRADSAIASHEFEKARFYSDEEHKERENLQILREKYPEATQSGMVGRADVEEVIMRWAAYPFRP